MILIFVAQIIQILPALNKNTVKPDIHNLSNIYCFPESYTYPSCKLHLQKLSVFKEFFIHILEKTIEFFYHF